jgi:hypothetical protein
MGQIVHGGKVFEQNVEQLVKIEGTLSANTSDDDENP